LEQGQIENLFNARKYSDVLKNIDPDGSSHWHDTVKLRCLRAVKNRTEAINKAESLFNAIESKQTSYDLSDEQRDEQLRYISLVFAEFGKPELLLPSNPTAQAHTLNLPESTAERVEFKKAITVTLKLLA